MNAKSTAFLAAAACLVGGSSALAVTGTPDQNQMGAQDQVATTPAPSQAYVMVAGHWDQVNAQWKWVAAHWELPPSRDSVYVAGHWAPQGGNWAWVNGAWSVGASATAGGPTDGPPQPPAAQNGVISQSGAMPSPGTPPPMVNGQDGSYVYDGAVTTDYAPIDYSGTYYPYYTDGAYWGYPGYWGGGYIGLGFYGGGYWRGGRWYGPAGGYRGGYGRGGYAHGGYGRGGSGGHAGGAAVHGGGGGGGGHR